MKTLIDTIKQADEVEVDGMFATLKYRSMGILRKMRVFALILDLDEEIVLKEAPKDDSGRLIDYEARHTICDALVSRSKELQELNK